MFQVLIASGPQARQGVQRLVLSIGVHVALIGTAAALARHSAGPTTSRPSEPELLYVASPPVRPSGPIPNQATSRPSGPLAPVWQPLIGLPDMDSVALPATVPGVEDLLRGATLIARPGPVGVGDATMAPGLLTADAVDDPVGVIDQPDPRYPAALAQAHVTGRVDLSYVVDTLGLAEPGSLRTLMTTHRAFDSAARASVLVTRYRPARLQGSLVRQLVRQTFTFRMRD